MCFFGGEGAKLGDGALKESNGCVEQRGEQNDSDRFGPQSTESRRGVILNEHCTDPGPACQPFRERRTRQRTGNSDANRSKESCQVVEQPNLPGCEGIGAAEGSNNIGCQNWCRTQTHHDVDKGGEERNDRYDYRHSQDSSAKN